MRISDWSSDVCSSDLTNLIVPHPRIRGQRAAMTAISLSQRLDEYFVPLLAKLSGLMRSRRRWRVPLLLIAGLIFLVGAYWAFSTLPISPGQLRSEEHTSELQSLMRISYAVFCLKKKKNTNTH